MTEFFPIAFQSMKGCLDSQTEPCLQHTVLLIVILLTIPALLNLDRIEAGNDRKTLLQLHNRERLKRKTPRLRMRGSLSRAAQNYAQTMDEYDHFGHTGPQGSTFSERIKREVKGLKAIGENLGYGQNSPRAVFKAWMRSSGHRRNILNRNFRYVGFGKAGEEPFWAASFGG